MIILALRTVKISLFLIVSFFRLRFFKSYGPVVKQVSSMGPVFIKLGQSFATRQDIIGVQLANELLGLCDNVFYNDFKYISSTIEAELGRGLHDLFEFIEKKPIASASIAQVHRAKTKCGRDVAVKVLKKDIEKIFKRDIRIILIFAHIFAVFLPKRLNIVAIIKRFQTASYAELDLRLEAASASELKDNTKDDLGFFVPEIFWDFTSQKIITTEWVDGIPLTRYEQKNQQIVNRLVLLFFKQVYRDGFFHADVHPGNIFVTKTNKIAVVDFGIMGRIDYQTKIYLLEVIKCFLKRDYHGVARAHFSAGYVDKKFENFATACRAIGEPIVGKPLNKISVANLLYQLFKLAADFEIEIQPHLLLLQKNMMLLEGNCAKIAPEVNIWNVISGFISQWYYSEYSIARRLKEEMRVKALGFLDQVYTKSAKYDAPQFACSGKLSFVALCASCLINVILVFYLFYKI